MTSQQAAASDEAQQATRRAETKTRFKHNRPRASRLSGRDVGFVQALGSVMSTRFFVTHQSPASAALVWLVLGVACNAGPESGVHSQPPVAAVQSPGELFVEITDQLRAAMFGAAPEPNPFRGDHAAAESYAHAYRSAFAYGAVGVGGWSHVGGDAAFRRGWSDGLRSGGAVWATLADKYGVKW